MAEKIPIYCELVNRFNYTTRECDIEGAIFSYEAAIEYHSRELRYCKKALKTLRAFKKQKEAI